MLKLRMCDPKTLVEPSANGAKVEYSDRTLKWWALTSLGLSDEITVGDIGSLIVLIDDDGGVVEAWAVMPHNPDTAYMVYPRDKMYEVVQ
jgi:hypothetical protein